MKTTLSPDRKMKHTDAVAVCGIFCGAALMLSYLESFLPLGALTGIPGIKLGLSNIAVIVVFYAVGRREALMVSLLRILLFALLFGSVTSFLFSLCGGLLAFCVLLLTERLKDRFFGMLGISMLSAALHNTGQLLAAAILLRSRDVFAYLPVLLLASIPCGALTGLIAGLLVNKIHRIRTARK